VRVLLRVQVKAVVGNDVGQDQPGPFMAVAVRLAGSVSATVARPLVVAVPVLVTVRV